MSQIKIDCPRCDQSTNVEMDQRLTGQRCEHCGSYLYSVDTGVKLDVENRKVRRKRWHSVTGTAARDLESETIDTTDAFQRRGWQVWYIPTFIVGLVAMIGIITFLVNRQRSESRLPQNAESNSVLQTSLQKAEKDTKNLVPAAVTSASPPPEWGKKASDISSQFLRATSAEEILPLVRNRETFAPEIQAYASKAGNLPIAKAGVLDIVYAPEEAGKTGTLAMLFFENKDQHVQGLVLAETPEGLLVDWPSFSGEGDMSIAEFLQKKPTEPVLLRVAARLDDYYNFEYQDRNLVTCLRLTDYPETIYFYGYVLNSVPNLKERTKHLPSQDHSTSDDLQSKPQPLTIKARFHVGSRSENQVEITEIMGNGWFVR